MIRSALRDRLLALILPSLREQWKLWASLGFVAAVYSFTAFAFMPQGVFWSPDSGMKYIQMQNIRWNNGLDLSIAYPGRALDPEIRVPPYHDLLYRVQDGRMYPVWLPYFSLLSKLPYELFGYPGLLVVPVLSGLAAAAASYWLACLCGVGRPSKPQGSVRWRVAPLQRRA